VEMALVEREHNTAANALIEAANVALLLKEDIRAFEHYRSAMNFYVNAPKVNKEKEVMHAACLASFIRLVQGRFKEAITFFKSNLQNNRFKNIEKDLLIQFTENVLNGIISKNQDYLQKAREIFSRLKLRDGEFKLCESVLHVLEEFLKFKIKSNVIPDKFHAGETFKFLFFISHPQDLTLLDSSLDHDASKLELMSELSVNENCKEYSLEFKAKVDGQSKIGPIKIRVQTADGFKFPLTISRAVKILPGKPHLRMIIEEQQLIKGEKNQLELLLVNEGRGEALDIELILEFPETLLFTGGSNVKKLHSLKANAKFPLSFLVTPLTSDSLRGKYILKYTDDSKVQSIQENELVLNVF
ncbi:MAG: hypothetical protein ACXQS8_00715, partial [Candidatus Helarchaeales archaeon]